VDVDVYVDVYVDVCCGCLLWMSMFMFVEDVCRGEVEWTLFFLVYCRNIAPLHSIYSAIQDIHHIVSVELYGIIQIKGKTVYMPKREMSHITGNEWDTGK